MGAVGWAAAGGQGRAGATGCCIVVAGGGAGAACAGGGHGHGTAPLDCGAVVCAAARGVIARPNPKPAIINTNGKLLLIVESPSPPGRADGSTHLPFRPLRYVRAVLEQLYLSVGRAQLPPCLPQSRSQASGNVENCASPSRFCTHSPRSGARFLMDCGICYSPQLWLFACSGTWRAARRAAVAAGHIVSGLGCCCQAGQPSPNSGPHLGDAPAVRGEERRTPCRKSRTASAVKQRQ